MSSTLEKLRALVDNRSLAEIAAMEDEEPQNRPVLSAMNEPQTTETTEQKQVTALEKRTEIPELTLIQTEEHEGSLAAQLKSLYEDLDFLAQKYPGYDLRSLIDYTETLEAQLQVREGLSTGLSRQDFEDFSQFSMINQSNADDLPFGLIELTDKGQILIYNQWESDMTGTAPAKALGKHFFLEIAPCTNNRLFYGRFKKGMSEDSFDVSFNYTFSYRMQPKKVRIRMLTDQKTSRHFIVVKLAE